MRRSLGVTLACAVLACSAGMAGCVGSVRLNAEQRKRAAIFDSYWTAIDQNYAFFGGDQVAWDELRAAYRPHAIMAETDLEFYRTLWKASANLLDGHVVVEPPQGVLDGAGIAGGDELHVVSAVLGGSAAHGRTRRGSFVVRWPEGEAPTPPLHLDPRHEVAQLLEIEGVPYRTITESTRLLLAEPGARVNLLLGWSDGSRSHHTLVARESKGSDHARLPTAEEQSAPPPEEIIIDGVTYKVHMNLLAGLMSEPKIDQQELSDGSKVSVVRYKASTLSADYVRKKNAIDSIREHYRAMLRPEEPIEAQVMVLDLRNNYGGDSDVVDALLDELLVPEVQMTFSRDDALVSHRTSGGADPGLPLVIWINENTLSAGEIVAGVMQARGGAIVVGEPTQGSVGGTHYYTVSRRKDTPRIAIPSQWVSVSGVPLMQRLGVTPDVPLVVTADELRDMRAALPEDAGNDALSDAYEDLVRRRWTDAKREAVERALRTAN
ncbi:MAG: S41 family peptidase [Phycisphaerales bacterium JB064]